jgi:2-polyprenyl-6-hydroxyphenyl methylase/3-demethylubiquinone-9 3-methyltransferase
MSAPPSTPAAAPPGAFEFGRNWSRFLEVVNEERIAAAIDSLTRRFGTTTLNGKRFLDAGSGSGLFSLAAQRLGAKVVSFDIDPHSVACTTEMKRRFAPDAAEWEILAGSALDPKFLESLGTFEVVYSWGVLHHTGRMWRAIDLVQERVAPGGQLWIALYNDQGGISDRWKRVKQLHQACPPALRTAYVIVVGGIWAAWRVICLRVPVKLAGMLLGKPKPDTTYSPYVHGASGNGANPKAERQRGMHWWYDLVDWIGGWPFEVAKPEEVLRFLQTRGFEITDLMTVGGGLGCNEFLFRRASGGAPPSVLR